MTSTAGTIQAVPLDEELNLYLTNRYEWIQIAAPSLLRRLRTESEEMRKIRWSMASPALKDAVRKLVAKEKTE